MELPLTAAVTAPERVAVRDGTFPGRVGWHAVVPRAGTGTAVRSDVPASDPTGGLRHYPQDILSSPADVRTATLSVAPGAGTLAGARRPQRVGGRAARRATTCSRARSAPRRPARACSLLLLLTAFAWGALHALSPGHGKAMVAAYLVGTRGTARHAVALGATVTITHTAGVFALGLVALGPVRVRAPRGPLPLAEPGLRPARARSSARTCCARTCAGASTTTHHHHHHPDQLSWRGIVAMGAAAGLIPCPSALVVLLGAVAQGQIALGMLMIVAFSLGLAATLTGLGIAVVSAGRVLGRLNLPSRVVTAIPAVSALLIVGVGIVLTVQAVPQVA